jgi:hypothetical protein
MDRATATEAAFWKQNCGGGKEQLAHAGLHRAETYVNDTLTYRYASHSTDQLARWTTNTLTVFRVPGSTAFDQELRRLATRDHVIVKVVDTKYTRRSMFATGDEVLTRRSELARCGAVWNGHAPLATGYLRVWVESHLSCAGAS